MEARSALPHRGHTPWQGLMLTEGSIVFLQTQNLLHSVFALRWFKGEEMVHSQQIVFYLPKERYFKAGPAYRGQQILFHDGSLMFQLVTGNDTGFYTLEVIQDDLWREVASVFLHVSSSSLPLSNWTTPANIRFELVPSYVFEGENILLWVHKLPKSLLAFRWFKGKEAKDSNRIFFYLPTIEKSKPGQAYSGREQMYPNGSLLFQNITQNDTGFYTLEMITKDVKSELLSMAIHLTSPQLTFWYRTTFANATVEIMPPKVIEGKTVLLIVHHLPQDVLAFLWFKGESTIDSQLIPFSLPTIGQSQGPAHTGREIMFPNGSLLLQGLTLKDTEFYTLQIFWMDYRMDLMSVEIFVFRRDILLQVHNLPPNLFVFRWFKGEQTIAHCEIASYVTQLNITTLGPASRHREIVYPDGSLLLQNVTLKDIAFYTLQSIKEDLWSETVSCIALALPASSTALYIS